MFAMKRTAPTERWLVGSALIALFPVSGIALALVWFAAFPEKIRWTVTAAVIGANLWFVHYLTETFVTRLRNVSSLLFSMIEGDYSRQMRSVESSQSLNEIVKNLNALSRKLSSEHTGTFESHALLEKVLDQVDVAMFAFDDQTRLRWSNRSGTALIGTSANRGKSAEELGLASFLAGEVPRVGEAAVAGKRRRWQIRRTPFREEGRPHILLLLSDLTEPLRREERDAWQRLLKVLRHEISNAVTPIASLVDTLPRIIQRPEKNPDWQEDLIEGLAIIRSRTAMLVTLMKRHRSIAGPSRPKLKMIEVAKQIRLVAAAESRIAVRLEPGPEVRLPADPEMLDQVLVNLVDNAVESALLGDGGVILRWQAFPSRGLFELEILDSGPGIANPEHLFVPFYTTKPDGNGIGLVLSRQIAEAHGGALSLHNREDASGARAILQLPLVPLRDPPIPSG
ncbi:Histidine kinase domain-containing protein [Sulfidibacter corallicola]|uniref:histidine kinase n=1 Tax=Sulfidibacter corallicola TaxID=2818388 RepID=A0A8A4TWC7_SULCO|nr:ATP-binding protein [Sulfidibacter corallicola]QTD53434.1 hypothetical protein J3U87_13350 [Sulfidibacter corallicola]